MKTELKHHYLCPVCRSHLRVWNNVVFSIRKEDGLTQGLLLLNPNLGDYSFMCHGIDFYDDEIVDFYCPVCHADLAAKDMNDKLVRVIMIDEDEKEYDIYFSRVSGEHSTFKVKKEDVIARFGENASSYVNYFMERLKQQKP